jgi:D-sedoheptulose 7-phosphate isomerase
MKVDELIRCIEKVSNDKIVELSRLIDVHEKIILLGNGGSSSIASHISQDYTKKLKKTAFTFSDSSRLTCYINDYGMEKAYAQFLSEFCDKSSLVILISSSGNSENILRCAEFCVNNEIKYATLTGFDESNKLRSQYSRTSSLDIWVDSHDYGVVECAHQAILHTPA